MSVQRYLGLGKEVTRGTGVAPTYWLPIAPNPTLEPKVTWLKDDGLRGSPVEQYDDIPGVRHDEFSLKGNVFNDTFPVLLMGLLGSPDTVTGTVAPYSHKIGVANIPSTGSQPASYTGVDVDNILEGANAAKQFTAGQIMEMTVNFTADGALTYTCKYAANPLNEVTIPTATWSTEVFVPAWSGVITLGTVQSSVVVSGEISIKRGTAPIHTIGQQGPYRVWAGPIDVSGKVMFVAEANDPTFTNSLTRDRQNLTCEFSDPVSSHSVTFQMSAVQLKDPTVTGDKAWEEISANFTAQSNTTDAVAGGYAPISTTTANGQSAAY